MKKEQGDKASQIVLTLISNPIRCYPEMCVCQAIVSLVYTGHSLPIGLTLLNSA